jgi:hypothetical protein
MLLASSGQHVTEQLHNVGWTDMSASYGLRRAWGVLKHSIHSQWGKSPNVLSDSPQSHFLAVGPPYIIHGPRSMDPYLLDSGLM